MSSFQYIIIGGGISGLYAAYLLEQRGITDYLLIEANDLLGGRLKSMPINEKEAFDLGATWFWPNEQIQLSNIIHDFGLTTFNQYQMGEMLIERSQSRPPQRLQLHSSLSKRVKGGMKTLIDKVVSKLDQTHILLSHQVIELVQEGEHTKVYVKCPDHEIKVFSTQQILVAIPPRLAVSTIQFTPDLPATFKENWLNTTTWMAPHAKYIAVYDHPFWRDQKLSGSAHSSVGPLAEVHDASSAEGSAALFGFIGLPAHARKTIKDAELAQHCRHQLVRLFGSQAATPKSEFIKDWAKDSLIATEDDQSPAMGHPYPPIKSPEKSIWQNKIIGISSEFSPSYSGYLAGAIEAVTLGIQTLFLKT
ncbi:FAD-dependent oxidoreductase [Acinetobacter sp.]|jgi:monoamine oxidase|uniref:flavin monoamine oxidase family protein n=1 Tax=Acinetobacter sp. TaxID=472 RepID=UPI00281AF7F3|nr:FAD-dependent oxidoreductase [Acinetobacter sp.]MDR0235747.1 FAD-dependent oxidoreductase [Acinetobacter sp.]